jgi:thermitase
MNKAKILIIATLALALLSSADFETWRPRTVERFASPPSPPAVGAPFVPGQVLVKFRADVPIAHQVFFLQSYGSRVIRRLPDLETYQLRLPEGTSVEEAVAAWSANPNVEYAEPNYIVRAAATPNDPLFNQQWALSNPGGTLPLPGSPIGKLGADIKATAGWEETKGSDGIVIAVLDTGVDLLHPDLKDKMYSNGRDFVNDDLDASDDNGHGTVVAGIAGAETNNSEGIAGVAWDCKILPVKVLDKDGVGTVDVVSDGIMWAADQSANGVRVINISWGLDVPSNTLRDAVEYAYGKDVVIVAAAGSNGGPVEFPAAYENYVLAVAATDYSDTRYDLSNTGAEVDVAAPGVDVMSTVPRGYYGPGSIDYGFWTGTSVAAPHVAGLAALIAGLKPFLTVDDIMNVIRFSADDVNATLYPGKDEFVGYGRIDMEKALVPLVITTGTTTPTATRAVLR